MIDKDVVQQLDPTDGIVVTEMSREWNIPGNNDDYTFTTIPPMMLTTSDERIYIGRLFVNKEDLKKILDMYAWKDKFKYRINRSNKTFFLLYAKIMTASLNVVQ